MLLVHGIPATVFRPRGHNVIELESKSTSNTVPTSGESTQDAGSWIDIDEDIIKTHESECSFSASVSSEDHGSTLGAALRCNTPLDGRALSGTTFANDSHDLDTTTFPFHATHLLQSEPNGTWRTQVSYAVTSPFESASTLRDILKEQVLEIDVPSLVHGLKEVAEKSKAGFERWLNQCLADQDLVEMHDRFRCLVPIPSMPNMRQIDHAVDTVADAAQSLRKRRSESELLEWYRDDKYIFAEVVGRKAQRALVELAICKEWQIQCQRHVQLQHAMHDALLRTFTRIRQSYTDVPLFQAQPQWIVKREMKVWRLKLDVGAVGVEVGPVTDRSLIELGFIDTGLELPESYGCVTVKDVDRQVQGVDDGW